ncbi:TRAM domain-containing protein [Candidatus Woesearchaeota archaeon]|nr:TRAM domain-containing protein [Candidatus Woesearchaeota archaeon]
MYRDRDREPRRFAPVKEGDELDVKIEAVGEKGDGIAKKQGFVLFIPKTKSGDEVRVRVTRVLKNAGFAEVIGDAVSKPEVSQPPKKEVKKEEEFEPDTEKDSEDFGDESEDSSEDEAEEVAEKADEDFSEDAAQDEEEKNE